MIKKLRILMVAVFLLPVLATAQQRVFEAENECHSGGTSWDGRPKSCSSEVCVAGYSLVHSTATVVKTNAYGATSECHQPKIVDTEEEDGGRTTRVTRICSSLNAKGPSGSGNAGKRGTVRCKLTVKGWDN